MVKFMFILFFIVQINVQSDNLEYVKKYNSSDILLAEGWLNNGIKNKYWIFYYQNSNVKEKGHFENGQKSGYWEFFYEDGKPESSGHLLNGHKEKFWTFFFTDGGKENGFYSNDQREKTWKTYNSNGQLIESGIFCNNKKHGIWVKFRNNKPYFAEKYNRGILEGSWNDILSFEENNNYIEVKCTKQE